MARQRSLRLSTRVTLFFGAMALLGGMALAVATFLFARNSLLDQRIADARNDAISHGITLRSAYDSDLDISEAVIELDHEPDAFGILLPDLSTDGEPLQQISSRSGRSLDDLPAELVEAVASRQFGQMLYVNEGDTWLAVGVNIRAYDVGYIEAFPLDSTENALRVLGTALTIGTVLAAIVATFFGWSTSRRLLRPVSRVADAAGDIASGSLEVRMDEESDPDLNRLAGSFNEMADAVQDRIEREQRFASDVSHEL
ncbi:MAG: HAMP domain-containing protein, partial [Ilumatobacter sp.]|nr:HAMP domain-containing protein [Ilumatobacter sp.]